MREDNIKKLIDFSLEITNGCQYNCTGCFVDKEGNSWPTDSEFERLLSLIDDLSANEFKPMNLQIGPTDILTSVNRDKILTDPRIQKLSQKFLKTAINCAFLDPISDNYVKLGKQLNWLLKGGLVKFVIPFEAYHIDNKPYIDRIRKRIQITLDNMPDVTHTKTYLIMNYETSSIYDKEQGKNLTEELILKTYQSELLDELDVGINLAHTRSDLRLEKNARAFYESAMTLKKYVTGAKLKYGNSVTVAELQPHEGKDWDIFYKAGKLYMTPFLLEGLASFDKEFEVTKDWTFKGLYESYLEGFLSQVDWAMSNKDCQGCQFVPMCAERGIHSLMKITNTTECISPIKPLENKVYWK